MILWENFDIPQLGRRRTVRISLPDNYGRKGAIHPVLYLQDAQNVFHSGESFSGHYWEAEKAQKAWRSLPGLQDLIIVAVDHAQQQRLDEYSPWVNQGLKDRISWIHHAVGGDGEAYASFLAETLKPAVEKAFLVDPSSEKSGIGGSSMGALIALYTGLKYPDKFGKILCLSPAFWFDLPELEKFIRTHLPQAHQRIYLSVGSLETSDENIQDFPQIYIKGTRHIAELLNPKMGSRMEYRVVDGAMHSEVEWAKIFPGAVEELWKLDLL